MAHRGLCGQEEGQAKPGTHTSNPWTLPVSTSKEDPLLSCDNSTASCFLVISKKGFCSLRLPLWCSGQKNNKEQTKPATMHAHTHEDFSKYLIHREST